MERRACCRLKRNPCSQAQHGTDAVVDGVGQLQPERHRDRALRQTRHSSVEQDIAVPTQPIAHSSLIKTGPDQSSDVDYGSPSVSGTAFGAAEGLDRAPLRRRTRSAVSRRFAVVTSLESPTRRGRPEERGLLDRLPAPPTARIRSSPRDQSLASPGDIEKKPEQLPDLPKGSRPDIASRAFDSARCHSSNVLALSRRHEFETVRVVGIDLDLRREPSKRRSEGYHLHNTRFCVEDSLRCHHDGWMTKPRFSSCRRTEIQVDDVTRGQHRASQPPQRSDQREGRLRSGPGEVGEPQERRSRPRSRPTTQPGP